LDASRFIAAFITSLVYPHFAVRRKGVAQKACQQNPGKGTLGVSFYRGLISEVALVCLNATGLSSWLSHTLHCSILSLVSDSPVCLMQVSPVKGTVGFASAQSGWSFTLQSFSKLYCEVYGIQLDHLEFARRLWGDLYFHPGDPPWL